MTQSVAGVAGQCSAKAHSRWPEEMCVTSCTYGLAGPDGDACAASVCPQHLLQASVSCYDVCTQLLLFRGSSVWRHSESHWDALCKEADAGPAHADGSPPGSASLTWCGCQ